MTRAPLAVVLVFAVVFTIADTPHRPAGAAVMPHWAGTPAELAAARRRRLGDARRLRTARRRP